MANEASAECSNDHISLTSIAKQPELPYDLWYMIDEHVLTLKDRLALALTCKAALSSLVPDHPLYVFNSPEFSTLSAYQSWFSDGHRRAERCHRFDVSFESPMTEEIPESLDNLSHVFSRLRSLFQSKPAPPLDLSLVKAYSRFLNSMSNLTMLSTLGFDPAALGSALPEINLPNLRTLRIQITPAACRFLVRHPHIRNLDVGSNSVYTADCAIPGFYNYLELFCGPWDWILGVLFDRFPNICDRWARTDPHICVPVLEVRPGYVKNPIPRRRSRKVRSTLR